jgi:hypothetical protein
MLNPVNKEKYVEILSESAIRRFGEERTRSLNPAIQETAAALAVIAEYKIELEEEPAFFL